MPQDLSHASLDRPFDKKPPSADKWITAELGHLVSSLSTGYQRPFGSPQDRFFMICRHLYALLVEGRITESQFLALMRMCAADLVGEEVGQMVEDAFSGTLFADPKAMGNTGVLPLGADDI